ncbi:hypothetical protein TSAR_013115 [Trichomalopsis sarcophagae]|uniref:Uncharacterized protein n=1 Tax=Trichomalopsis sarcophagae TaxID=543379 RepID=A0A232ERI8_9HYME|nr:hypothetical protein TSAR_013115 [Trichomalopsis sarcophagae]
MQLIALYGAFYACDVAARANQKPAISSKEVRKNKPKGDAAKKREKERKLLEQSSKNCNKIDELFSQQTKLKNNAFPKSQNETEINDTSISNDSIEQEKERNSKE